MEGGGCTGESGDCGGPLPLGLPADCMPGAARGGVVDDSPPCVPRRRLSGGPEGCGVFSSLSTPSTVSGLERASSGVPARGRPSAPAVAVAPATSASNSGSGWRMPGTSAVQGPRQEAIATKRSSSPALGVQRAGGLGCHVRRTADPFDCLVGETHLLVDLHEAARLGDVEDRQPRDVALRLQHRLRLGEGDGSR